MEAQQERIRSAVEARGWRLVEIFVDAGASGRRADRPALRELLSRLGEFQALVVVSLDRLFRSTRHCFDLFAELKEHGVSLVCLAQDGFDTSTPWGKMALDMLVVMAEFESGLIAERVKSVARTKAQQGRYHGGPPPYGYRLRKGTGETASGLVPDPVEAQTVRRIFREYCDGQAQNEITRGLIRNGIPARRGEWYQGTLAHILGNPIYAGKVRLKGETHPGMHEAIIDEDTWRRAELIRTGRRRWNGSGKGANPRGNHLILHKLLRCGECGGPMVPRTDQNRRSGPYAVYQCHNRDRFGRDHCSQPPVPRRLIDETALDHLKTASIDLADSRERLIRAIRTIITENEAFLQDAQLGIANVAARHDLVRRHYQDGRITPEDWNEQRALLAAEARAEQARADRLQAHLDRMNRYLTTRAADQLDQAIATISHAVQGSVIGISLDSARATIAALFDSFTLNRDDDGNYTLTPKLRPRSLMMPRLPTEPNARRDTERESSGIEVLPVFNIGPSPSEGDA